MKKIFFLSLAFILGLNLQSLNAQSTDCTDCTTTYKDATISSSVSLSGTVCFTGTSNTISGDISSIADGTTICVGKGTTLNLNSNNYNSIAGSVTVNVYGTLKFGTSPNLAGKWTFNVFNGGTMNYGTLGFNSPSGNLTINNSGTFSGGKLEVTGSTSTGSITNTGAMTLTDDLSFAGSSFTFYNNSATTLNLKTIALSNSSSTFTVTNYTGIYVSSTLNLNNGTGQFKNLGTLTVGQNYNSSPTSTYVNCGTFNGKFNLNGGGKLINTGTFNTSQIDYGGPTSRVENYGRFNVSGNINLGGSGSVFYNEGITTFTSGQFQSDGNLQGPSDASKKGYFIWPSSNKANMNSGSIGPNLNFSTNSGNSNEANMFNNPGSLTWLSGITWGGTQPTTLPATDCPQPDGTPAVPVPKSTSVCVGFNLTSLQTYYSNVTYEWYTGTSTTRTAQITGSFLTNYTTAGTVYLWAKNVSSGVYSASGAAVTVNALPTITLSSSAINVCYRAFAQTTNLTYSATTGSPTTYNITWNSSPANSFASVSNATLNASPISISVPAGTVAGTYTGYLTVKNASSCSSTSSTFTVTINKCPRLCLVSNKMVTPKIKR